MVKNKLEPTEYQKQKIREQNRVYREKLKRNHRCVSCGKTDERTLSGLTRCNDCTEKQRKSYKAWYQTEHGRQVNREKRRRLGYRRVNRGLCVGCGKNPPEPDKLYCTDCLRKASEQNKARKERLKEQCST